MEVGRAGRARQRHTSTLVPAFVGSRLIASQVMGRGLVPDARSIRRVDFGYFVRPPEERGTGQARVESCLGYVVAHPEDGFLLFDTGMGSTPDVDRHYRPTRRPLAEALRPLGVTVHDVRLVVNCHLHFDHCGGNPELADRPVFVQAAELESAQLTPDYTLPELIDFPGARYEKLNGEATPPTRPMAASKPSLPVFRVTSAIRPQAPAPSPRARKAVPAGNRTPQFRGSARTPVERRDVLGGLIHEYRWAA
jgi:hypothetical protein